jgi:hypothetical protein
MGGVRWDCKALQPPTQAQASVLGRAPRYMVHPTELSSSDWRAPQSRALGCSQSHMQANSEMRGALSSRPRPTASPVDDRLRGLSARASRGSHSTYRKSGSAIFSDRETGNEREIQNGNGLEAKGACPAWIGAALSFTLSPALEPLEAEAQEATTPAAAPPAATGTHGMQRRQGRRTHRSERRHGRHERRHTRRTGEPAPAAAPAPQ